MWWAFIKKSVLLALMLSCVNKAPEAKRATLYLASSLSILKDDIEKLTPKNLKIDLIFQSSSVIAKHLANGAPCEIAILADDRWRDYLLGAKVATAYEKPLASNSLVLAALPATSQGWAQFIAPSGYSKLIIADPDYVPLGSYTQEALTSLGLYDKWKNRFVKVHNAHNAVILLKERAADFAIIYKTDAAGLKILQNLDRSLYRPISYPVLVCKRGEPKQVQWLLEMLFSPEFESILRVKGFLIREAEAII